MKLDVVAIAPHPDDVELHCGGLMIRLADLGYKTGIIDMSRGEMSTRGTVKERTLETEKASDILGLTYRINLELPDARLGVSETHRETLIDSIRMLRPNFLLVPHKVARHPDHEATFRLGWEAAFLAGLEKIKTGHPAFRPNQVIFYFTHHTYKDQIPSFIVDITSTFDRKITAIKTYCSQFHKPDSVEPETFISRPEFLNDIEIQSRYYGSLIGKAYGEPFFIREYLSVNDPIAFLSAQSG